MKRWKIPTDGPSLKACFIILFVLLPASMIQGREITVGAVIDGPFPHQAEVKAMFKKEMAAFSSAEFTINFPDEKILTGDWKPETIRKLLNDLLEDSSVHIILAGGLVASSIAIQAPSYAKPVIAPFLVDRKLQNAPYKNGTSGVHNLSYLDLPQNIKRDIRYFKDLCEFENLAFMVNAMLPRTSPEFTHRVGRLAKEMECTIKVVPAGLWADSVLKAIPANTDAVYLYSLLHMEDREFDKLVKGLQKRRLPSFSSMGERQVKKGIMVSLNPDPFRSIARRIAVNIQRILMGEDPATFPVHYSAGERLTFNMETARIIGFEPAWFIFNEANIVGEIRRDSGRILSLKKAAQEAVNRNLDLTAGKHETASARQDVNAAWSSLMPKLEVGGTGLIVEEEIAAASMNTQPEYSGKLYGSVTQVLFSEQANTNISIQNHSYMAQKNRWEQLKLDVVMDLSEAYINVLRSLTLESIRRENMERNRTYLQLARMRVSVGSAGTSEVLRWESQIAASQNELIEANSLRNMAEIAVNRLLNRPLEESFRMEERSLEYDDLLSTWNHYNECFSTKTAFRAFREFMVSEALENAPELKALDEVIAIQERVVSAANRAFWIPTLALQGEVDNTVYKAGAGSNPPPGYPDNFNWTVAANLSLPIYQGHEVFARRKGHLEAMAQKRLERESAVEQIEQRMRSHLHQAGATYAGIKQAYKAADAAERALELVRDAYARGAVSITELTDAQAQAQIAKEAESDAVFNYLLNLMRVQRASGQFDFFRTTREDGAFKDRLGKWMEKKARPE